MAHSLKPGGLLVLQGYTPHQLKYGTGEPPFASHLYTLALLREVFADLKLIELVEYEDELSEGVQHHGPAEWIGLVARNSDRVKSDDQRVGQRTTYSASATAEGLAPQSGTNA